MFFMNGALGNNLRKENVIELPKHRTKIQSRILHRVFQIQRKFHKNLILEDFQLLSFIGLQPQCFRQVISLILALVGECIKPTNFNQELSEIFISFIYLFYETVQPGIENVV